MKIHAAVIVLAAGILMSDAQGGFAQDVSTYPTNTAVLPGKGPAAKWSGLPKAWADCHTRWAATAANDKDGVVFLGDSITELWKTQSQEFPGLKVVNRGISGDTTRGVLYRLDSDVLSLDPRAIVLLIGTNDIGAGADPADISDNIKDILRRIRKKCPEIPIIVC
ncbi:MAG TPA: GDSL-type esterase/lipase family protein, partial [Verrucomicrobiae bacterium]|nr:GDSL-type esterase/lipase family protein [Verrucomicrobiae bacterium]